MHPANLHQSSLPLRLWELGDQPAPERPCRRSQPPSSLPPRIWELGAQEGPPPPTARQLPPSYMDPTESKPDGKLHVPHHTSSLAGHPSAITVSDALPRRLHSKAHVATRPTLAAAVMRGLHRPAHVEGLGRPDVPAAHTHRAVAEATGTTPKDDCPVVVNGVAVPYEVAMARPTGKKGGIAPPPSETRPLFAFKRQISCPSEISSVLRDADAPPPANPASDAARVRNFTKDLTGDSLQPVGDGLASPLAHLPSRGDSDAKWLGRRRAAPPTFAAVEHRQHSTSIRSPTRFSQASPSPSIAPSVTSATSAVALAVSSVSECKAIVPPAVLTRCVSARDAWQRILKLVGGSNPGGCIPVRALSAALADVFGVAVDGAVLAESMGVAPSATDCGVSFAQFARLFAQQESFVDTRQQQQRPGLPSHFDDVAFGSRLRMVDGIAVRGRWLHCNARCFFF